jgi:hypothetical protein
MSTIADLNTKRTELNTAIDAYKQAVLDFADGLITRANLDNAELAAQTKGDEYAKLAGQVKKDNPATEEEDLFSNPQLMSASVRQDIASIVRTGSYKRPMIWVVDTTQNPVGYQDQADLGLRGASNDITVDWGDGTVDENLAENKIHTYSVPGVYEIKLTGRLDYRWPTNANVRNALIDVKQWGTEVEVIRYTNFFRSVENFTISAKDSPTFPVGAHAGNMFDRAIFDGDITHWDVSNVATFNYMFQDTNGFNQDLSGWDVSNGTDFSYMFEGSVDFNQDLSGWDVSNGTNFNNMFEGCVNFDQDLSGWDVSSSIVSGDFALGSPINGTSKMPNF